MPIIAGVVSAVAGAILIGLVLWLLRRRRKNGQKSRKPSQPLPTTSRDLENDSGCEPATERHGVDTGTHGPATAPAPALARSAAAAGPLQAITRSREQESVSGKGSGLVLVGGDAKASGAKQSLTATTSTANMSTAEQGEIGQVYERVPGAATVADEESTPGGAGNAITLSTSGRRGSRGSIGLGEAVMDAAQNLAHHCQIPGVSEAASLVSTLVTMVSDRRDIKSGGDSNLRQCRSIIRMLERASKVAGRVSSRIPFQLRGFDLCLQGSIVSPIFS